MPTIRQLARLFRSLSEKDLASAEQIARQITQFEEKKGHFSAAQALRAALHSNGTNGHRAVEPISGILTNGNFLEAALSRGRTLTRLKDVMLPADCRFALTALIEETKHGTYLSSKGIRRRTRLLFVGPPGCGKSFTTQAIANELGLPHYAVRFDAIIGSYLGQTASQLREIFRFAAQNPCVLVFDEIDALGKQRGSLLDVGELDRVVIALMQELEFLQTPGIVIATSNLPDQLDRALWRRFDLIVRFPRPTRSELGAYAARVRDKFGLSRKRSPLKAWEKSKTYADVEKAVECEARSLALSKVATT